MLVIFTNGTCKECKNKAGEIKKLAWIMQDNPSVGRVDCSYDLFICDLLVNHDELIKNIYPIVVMVTKDKIYLYANKTNHQI